MAGSRKYAGLPDIDVSSQDVFETPGLADDVSTLPTTDSSPPSESGLDDGDETGISHPRIRASTARTIFTNANIDASDVDFSDRVSSKRKSYKSSTRRRRQQAGSKILPDGMDDEEFDDESDEEEESVGRKLARLRREMEELKVMVEEEKRVKEEMKEGDEVEGTDEEDPEEEEEGWERLSEALEGLMTARGRMGGAESELARKLASVVKMPPEDKKDAEKSDEDEIVKGTHTTTSYTISYSPHFRRTHTLAKVADFDSRLTLLERLLGISTTTSLATLPSNNAVIPAIETLTQQLTILTTSSATSLDAASRRVKALTNESEKLAEARRAAKNAAEDARRAAAVVGVAGGAAAAPPSSTDDEAVAVAASAAAATAAQDAEKESKINALYGTLGTIEGLAPLLPAVLDRLRSLRGIHAEAARSVNALETIERKQEEMQGEIGKWKEALMKVESAVKENEGVVSGNVNKVEEWVRDLEDKVKKMR